MSVAIDFGDERKAAAIGIVLTTWESSASLGNLIVWFLVDTTCPDKGTSISLRMSPRECWS